MILIRVFTCLFLLLTIISCSNFSHSFVQNRGKEYLKATSVAPLSIPPNTSSAAFHNEYPIPNHYYPQTRKEVSLIPPGL